MGAVERHGVASGTAMALHCGGGAAAGRVGIVARGGAGRAWRSGDGVEDFGG